MPIIFEQEVDKNKKVAVWHITENIFELLQRLKLDANELAFLENLHKGTRFNTWIGSRVLIRQMLNTAYFIDMRTDEFGRPFLKDFSQHISISHARDYAAVYLSDKKTLGIDIEAVNPKAKKLAERFLNEDEIAMCNAEEDFTLMWGIKECVFKYHGTKSLAFKNIHITSFDPKNNRAKSYTSTHVDLYIDVIEDHSLVYTL
jgi:4'-phosphopantetheinyl transferase